jgi:hypothetical protein
LCCTVLDSTGSDTLVTPIQPLVHSTTITCMEGIPRREISETASSCLCIGTESRQVVILDPQGFSIVVKAVLPSVPAFICVTGMLEVDYRVVCACRDGRIYTIKNGQLLGTSIELGTSGHQLPPSLHPSIHPPLFLSRFYLTFHSTLLELFDQLGFRGTFHSTLLELFDQLGFRGTFHSTLLELFDQLGFRGTFQSTLLEPFDHFVKVQQHPRVLLPHSIPSLLFTVLSSPELLPIPVIVPTPQPITSLSMISLPTLVHVLAFRRNATDCNVPGGQDDCCRDTR